MLICCSFRTASWFARIFSVDEVMLKERSLSLVMIPAYGSIAEEEEPKEKGWAGGDVGAEIGWEGA